MKYLTLLISALSVAMFPSDSYSQNSGYLGHKFQFQVGTSLNLAQKNMGLGKFTLPDVSARYTTSRRNTFGVEFSQPIYELNGTILRGLANVTNVDNYFIMPLNSTNIEVNYDWYSGIAPLQRFFKVGIGADKLSYKTDDLPYNSQLEKIEDDSATIPYLAFGIGTNCFLTDHIYLNLGVDLNMSFASASSEFLYYRQTRYIELLEEGNNFKILYGDTRTEYYFQKLIEFHFSVGVNI